MDTDEIKANVKYVKNRDIARDTDPVWKAFVDHILSVGNADQMNFAMKEFTTRGSETFKEIRDEQIARNLNQALTLCRTASGKMSDLVLRDVAENEEQYEDEAQTGPRRSNRRATTDTGVSKRRSTLLGQSRRGTRESSIAEFQFGKRRSTTVSMGGRRNTCDASPNIKNNSQDMNASKRRSTLDVDPPDSRRSSANNSRRNSIDNNTDSPRNAVKTRKISNATAPPKRTTQPSDKLKTRKISTARDILAELEKEALQESYDNDETSQKEAAEREDDRNERNTSFSSGWRAVRRDVQDKHLEKIKEEDPGGWTLVANTAGYLTDSERARQKLYARYIGSEKPWYEGLKTFEQYKHVIEDIAAREKHHTKLNTSRKAFGLMPVKARPASVAAPRPKPVTIGKENKEQSDKIKHRPSTCPPFRSKKTKHHISSAKVSYDRRAEAELRQGTILRTKTAFENS